MSRMLKVGKVSVLFFWMASNAGIARAEPAKYSTNLDKQALDAILKKQEDLVQAMEMEYEKKCAETNPKNIEDIKNVCSKRQESNDWRSFIAGARYVRQNSFKVHWWGKGKKEKIECIRANGNKVITAYDG